MEYDRRTLMTTILFWASGGSTIPVLQMDLRNGDLAEMLA